jgi:transposase
MLLVQRSDRLSDEERDCIDRLCAREPAIAAAYESAREFATMAREWTGHSLGAWLTKATASGIGELRGFARGLVEDEAAVEAGFSLEWSNGQTEGQVNRLKLLKQSMYRRANFDLLRLRALRAA